MWTIPTANVKNPALPIVTEHDNITHIHYKSKITPVTLQ